MSTDAIYQYRKVDDQPSQADNPPRSTCRSVADQGFRTVIILAPTH